jgi:hypothetical protein
MSNQRNFRPLSALSFTVILQGTWEVLLTYVEHSRCKFYDTNVDLEQLLKGVSMEGLQVCSGRTSGHSSEWAS